MAKIKFTYQDYLLMPEDKQYELMEGEFHMMPAPNWSYQTIVRNLSFILYDFVSRHQLGEVQFAPLDVILSDEDVVQPDILYLSKERFGIISEKGVQGAPDLVVEILSSGTKERDRGIKRKLYAKYGVKEYWIVDPSARTIEVLALCESGFQTVRVYPEGTRLSSPLISGLSIDLDEIF